MKEKTAQAEQAAMELMGASSEQMSAEERQATFADDFGAGKWKVLCEKGTAVIMDYNIWHRSPTLAASFRLILKELRVESAKALRVFVQF